MFLEGGAVLRSDFKCGAGSGGIVGRDRTATGSVRVKNVAAR